MGTPSEAWERLAKASFVSLGTIRKTGEIVRTPVWIAPHGAALVVTTEDNTGKVRRLKRTPRVVLRVCDRMGNLSQDAPDVDGIAVLVRDETQTAEAMRSLRKKYGLQFAAVLTAERLIRRLQRRPPGRTIISIAPAQ